MPRLFYKRVEEKLRGAFHHRIRTREKLFVVGKFVVMPKVCAKPGAARGPEAPEWAIDRRCLSPQIGVVMAHPTARAIVNSSRPRTILNELRYQSQQWLMTLRQVRRFDGPVVHLRVDVDGVLAFPRWRHEVVPDPLQVRGLRAGPRRRDQEIPPVLEIECGKVWIQTL